MRRVIVLSCGLFLVGISAVRSEPLIAPGDLRLRHDLQLLNDEGVINLPMTTWPLASNAILAALPAENAEFMPPPIERALYRVRGLVTPAPESYGPVVGLSAASQPRIVRSFENTPRDNGEMFARWSWMGDRLAVNLAATYVPNPFDGDNIRPDGTYLGVALGDWIVTAGWQERWFGPGRDASLILSDNARPSPGIAIQRSKSTAFKSRWLHWIGPWTLTGFMTVLDDDRAVNDAWLFGLRGSFRPLPGLEIGISRAAQWCGADRPCDLSTFVDLLVGNDNKGVNINADDEPGNQLGGFDIRWSLPRNIPLAVYLQWIGEDGRGGGGQVGSWLRQAGVEYRGTLGASSYRTHLELSDTMCREGGIGLGDDKPDCAYGHHIYRSGYRYQGRALGHAADSDSRSFSVGSTLLDANGHSWSVILRHVEINRAGLFDPRHTLSAEPRTLRDMLLTHTRLTGLGRINVGLGYRWLEATSSVSGGNDAEAFIRWTSR